MNCLEIEQLAFERDDTTLFEGLDAKWQAGAIVQLAGRNGSGKTTLLRCITGLLHPATGSIRWNQRDVNSYEFRSSLLYLGHQVGIKLSMTPMENLRWYFGLNGDKSVGTSGARTLTHDFLLKGLELVGLGAFADIPCQQLSAGQKRRAALARLYCSKAPVWLLDEPFTAIDKSGVAQLEQCIEAHANAGGIVILTTHQRWNATKIQEFDIEAFQPRLETGSFEGKTSEVNKGQAHE